MVLGCCPTSRLVDLDIHMHCLKRYHGLYMMLRKNYLVAIDRQMLHVGNRLKLIDELSICSPRWNDSSVVCSRPFPFSSLPPAWGGTRSGDRRRAEHRHFNPPTPRGGDVGRRSYGHHAKRISIHPPRVGWDAAVCAASNSFCISIHPPRVGWDVHTVDSSRLTSYFNPPTPRGVGPCLSPNRRQRPRFQSTHPAWGGTAQRRSIQQGILHFNPPTPRGVGPPEQGNRLSEIHHFNPPTPRGVGLPWPVHHR